MKTASDRRKAKAIIVEVVRQSGGEFSGQTRLYKAFLLAHLFYFKDCPGFLTEWPIVHMPHGHGIEAGPDLINELEVSGTLTTRIESDGPYPETVFASDPTENDSLLDDDDRHAIKKALAFIKGKSARELSDRIHDHSLSYKEGQSGRSLGIYIDTFPEIWINEQTDRYREMSRDVDKIFLS